jgi:hypothetical protein
MTKAAAAYGVLVTIKKEPSREIAPAQGAQTWETAMWESEPHLTADGNLQRCSACGYGFPADVRPSMSVAFAGHLMKVHDSRPIGEESSSYARLIGRQGTESRRRAEEQRQSGKQRRNIRTVLKQIARELCRAACF